MSASALMVLGTASHAGKSLFVTALCRLCSDRGIHVAPFKAQNMSLEAAATPDGGEIGRAQALQAEAARRAAHVDMNPVLIKPTGDRHAQVIVEGRLWDDVDAWDYHTRRTAELFPRVVAAYRRLAARADLVILEGAGSPAEINLRAGDIANLRMAAAADAPCVLVVDIDRGGAFAALVGTLALLEPDERARIAGFVINKFRGDVALLRSGIAEIERRTGIPCFGVVPWLDDVGLEEEDGYAPPPLDAPWPAEEGPARRLRAAIVRYPHAANVSDGDALRAEPAVVVRDVGSPAALAGADVAILPGSKATIADLAWLRERGLDDALYAHVRRGGTLLAVCGGLQMAGTSVDDPHGVEGGGRATGLGLLRISTTLAREKTVRRVAGMARAAAGAALAGRPFAGYEIHLGRSAAEEPPFASLRTPDGETADDGAAAAGGRVAGTYVHGLLDDDAFRHAALDAWRAAAGLEPATARTAYAAQRDARLDRWARHVAAHVDVGALLALAGVATAAAR